MSKFIEALNESRAKAQHRAEGIIRTAEAAGRRDLNEQEQRDFDATYEELRQIDERIAEIREQERRQAIHD